MQDNRPAVYLEGNTVVYRASALGGCQRALWAARNAMDRLPIPDVVKRGMDEGTALEPTILNLLYDKYDWTFADGGKQYIVEMVVGEYNGLTLMVRGKVDDIGCPAIPNLPNSQQNHRPIDVKAFTNDDVEKYRKHGFAAFPRYGIQQSIYCIGYEADMFYMPIFNKGTWQIEEFSLAPQRPPYTRADIAERVLAVEIAFATGNMPESCPADYACQYPYLHEGKQKDELPVAAQGLAHARIIIATKVKALEASRKLLDEKLKDLLPKDVQYSFEDNTIKHFDNTAKFNSDRAKEFLTEAGIDWQADTELGFMTLGEGSQVRFTPPRKKKDS